MKKTFAIAALCCIGLGAAAQQYRPTGYSDDRTPGMKPEMTELYAPQPAKVEAGDIKTASAPSDAIVLFDGKNLDQWTNSKGEPAGWKVNKNGTMTVDKSAGDIVTKENFGDFQLHIEFCVPAKIHGEGQARGNSGIFLQGKYEIQVLDNYENQTYINGMVGSIYKQSAPLVNPSRKPGEWNVFDILYTAPTFRADGSFRTKPLVTVLLNGVLVQYNTSIIGTTDYVGMPTFAPHGDGPIILQSHGDPSEPISFRNIWIRKL